MKKGEITVFLSLVLVLLVSFVLGLLQISVIHTSKNFSRLATDRAVFSVFGEYDSRLLKDYHVFAIDGSYQTGEYSEERILNRMYYYEESMTGHEITDIQLLTDNGGQSFREQVLAYMEEVYGIGLIREFTGLTGEWEEQEIQGEEIKEKEESILDQLEELKESAPAPEDGKEESEPEERVPEDAIPEGNPFTCVEQIENAGILSVVLPEGMNLSGKKIRPGSQASNRGLNTGRGSFPARQGTDGIEEKLLFNEYILQNFTTAAGNGNGTSGEEAKERSLSYEAEYILAGKPSDKENLESVLMKLFLIRMALNYAYLLGDSAKQAEAETLAVVITTLLLIPEGAEVLKQLILLAWAAGEGVVDIRTLLSGSRVPLVKTKESWQLPLSGRLTLGNGKEQIHGADEQSGMSYEDYLRAFLFLTDPADVTMRVMDRIEENLALEYGMDHFRADQCVTKIRMKNTATIFGGLTYTYPVYFGYE